MTPKKPDRWERMVRRCLLYGYGSCVTKLVSMAYAIKLLRQQHAWMVRMLGVERRRCIMLAAGFKRDNPDRKEWICRAAQTEYLLNSLKRRAQ